MNRKRCTVIYIVFGIVILLPYIGFVVIQNWYSNKVDEIKYARFIVVDKTQMTLTLFDYQGENLLSVPYGLRKSIGKQTKMWRYENT